MKHAIASILLLAFLLVGCETTPKQTAYTTLATVGLSVQKAMQSVAAGYVAGKIKPEDWQKVAAVHDTKFLPAYRAACDLAGADYTQFAPADLLRIEQELLVLIAQLTGGDK